MSENLDLVRSIYVFVERGELSLSRWADPEIEWVTADGPEPGTYVGVARMEEGLGRVLEAWVDYRVTVEEFREIDEQRVLVLTHRTGRGKESGLELARMRTEGATLYHVLDGKVTRVVNYLDRDRALADLGLSEHGAPRENVEIVRRAIDAFSRKDAEAFAELTTPDFEWKVGLAAVEGEIFRGEEGVRAYFARLGDAWEDFRFVIDETREGDGVVVALGRLRGRGRGGGVPVDSPVGAVWELRRGRIWRLRAFLDHADALDAAGLES